MKNVMHPAVIFLAATVAWVSGLTISSQTEKQSAITKVVRLLQAMGEKSKEDAERDRVAFAKVKCNCDHTDAKLSSTIEETTEKISLLESKIQELYGATGRLSTEAGKLHADLKENKASQEEAIKLRESEKTDIRNTERDMLSSIKQMDYALKTLSEVGADQTLAASAHSKDFMSGRGFSLVKMTDKLQKAFAAASAFASEEESSQFDSFLQAPFSGDYKAQSGQVVGILKNMKQTFKQNLDNAKSDDAKAKEHFNEFMATKQKEQVEMTHMYASKRKKLSSNDEAMAAMKQQYDSAKETKQTAEEDLAELRTTCTRQEKEYEKRQLLRTNEETAIAEAVSILDNEHAFETFGKVKSTNFLQYSQESSSFLQTKSLHKQLRETRKRAQHILKKANTISSSKLSKVIDLLEEGDQDSEQEQKEKNPFTDVMVEISKMIDMADTESEQDQEKLDWCTSENKENTDGLANSQDMIEASKGRLDDLNADINDPETGLLADIKGTEADLLQNHQNQKDNQKTRDEEYANFKEDENNMKNAVALLGRAIKVLKHYYETFVPSVEASFLQTDEESESDDSTEADQGENRILGMLEYLERETKEDLHEAKKDEDESWETYQANKKRLEEQQSDLEDRLAEKQTALAKAKRDLGKEKKELKVTTREKEKTEKYMESIKPGCDFMSENFEHRKETRAIEKQALEQAQTAIKETPYYSAYDADTGALRGHEEAYHEKIGQYQ